jgi:hypothetical protein
MVSALMPPVYDAPSPRPSATAEQRGQISDLVIVHGAAYRRAMPGIDASAGRSGSRYRRPDLHGGRKRDHRP